MYGFTDLAIISKSIFDFFSKRIDIDAIIEKIISIIFIIIDIIVLINLFISIKNNDFNNRQYQKILKKIFFRLFSQAPFIFKYFPVPFLLVFGISIHFLPLKY